MFKWFLKLALWALSSGLLLVAAGAVAIYLHLEPKLPSIEILKEVRMQVPLRIYTSDGKLMAEFGEKKRVPCHTSASQSG